MKSKNQKNDEDAQKKELAESLDITFAAAAEAISTRTELIECCDWDDDRANCIIQDFSKTIETLAEYGKYNESFEYKDFENLIKLNMKEKTTDEQFKVLMKMLKIEAVEQIKNRLLIENKNN